MDKNISKQLLEEVYGNLFKPIPGNKRRVKLHVLFSNEQAAAKWMDEFSELIKKELQLDEHNTRR